MLLILFNVKSYISENNLSKLYKYIKESINMVTFSCLCTAEEEQESGN